MISGGTRESEQASTAASGVCRSISDSRVSASCHGCSGLAFGEPAVARQHAAPGRVRRRFPDVLHLHIAAPFGCSRSRGTPRMRQRCIEMIPPAAADAHQVDDVVSVSIGGMAGSSADAMRTAPVPAGIGGRSGLYCRGRSEPTRTGCCTAWRRRRPRPAARRACPCSMIVPWSMTRNQVRVNNR